MSSRRVLVVDDSALIRQVISDALVPAGFEVSTASDGKEALDRIAESPPDLMIADILMPVMDGWALCEEVRRDPATRDLPIIILTTERDVPKRIKGLEMGADDYVCKPFSKEEVVARVEAVLRRAGTAGTEARRAGAGASTEPAAAAARLSGHTDQIPISDLLQLLSMNGRTGTLHLWGESVGRVYFSEGRILNAEAQGLKGEKALFRIMAWPSARFELEPGEPPRQVEAALAGGTPTLLMEGFAHIDELRDLIARLPSRDTKLRVPPERASGIDAAGLSTAQRIILYTAGARGASVGEMIDTVPDRDLEGYRALSDLIDKGLLETHPDEGTR